MTKFERRVLEMHRDGWLKKEIAAAVGRHPSNIGRLLKKLGVKGPAATTAAARSSTLIQSFVTDPRGVLPELAALTSLSEAKSLKILQAAKDEVGRNHEAATDLVDCCVELFELRLERQSSPALQRRSRCMLAVSLALKATVERRSGRLAACLRLISRARREGAGCKACKGLVSQARAVALAAQGRRPAALKAIGRSLLTYDGLGGVGHDFDGLPVPRCHAIRAEILCHERRYEEGLVDAESALGGLPPSGHDGLRQQALSALAWCQLRMPARLERLPFDLEPQRLEAAAWTVRQIEEIIDTDPDDGSSVQRATTYWASGVIDFVRRNPAAAEFKLGMAQEDFRDLNMPDEYMAVTADLAEVVAENPERVQAVVTAAWHVEKYVPHLRGVWDCCHRSFVNADGLRTQIAQLRHLALAPPSPTNR